MPWTLNACLPSNFQCQLLKKLRIICGRDWGEVSDQTGPLFLYPVSAEKIEMSGAAFQSLQISWSHLTSAKVTDFNSEEITQLFQLASHMTHCQIVSSQTITVPAMPLGDYSSRTEYTQHELGILIPSSDSCTSRFSYASKSSRISHQRDAHLDRHTSPCAAVILSLDYDQIIQRLRK